MTIDYDGRCFRTVQNSRSGEVDSATIFRYRQRGPVVWAEYSGGQIVRGSLIATMRPDGVLDMRYHHLNARGVLMTGICRSTPELLADGRIRLKEEWQWTCGERGTGCSVMEEFLPEDDSPAEIS
ncbi:MAG: hypothetical protein WKF34_13895 [Pyrinomonadaceae bacterium]